MLTGVSAYPSGRPTNYPPSPAAHLRNTFNGLLGQSRHDLFLSWQSHRLSSQVLLQSSGWPEEKAKFIAKAKLAVAEQDFSIERWTQIKEKSLQFRTAGLKLTPELLAKLGKDEIGFNKLLDMYLNHESAWTSPHYALSVVCFPFDPFGRYWKAPYPIFPDFIQERVIKFVGRLEEHFAHFEANLFIPETFYAVDSSLSSAEMVTREELASLIKDLGELFALRFIASDFEVGQAQAVTERNTFQFSVDPNLKINLPGALLLPKIAGNIKNGMREVFAREVRLDDWSNDDFDRKSQSPFTGLGRRLAGKKGDEPVLLRMEAMPVTDKVWELRTSDNGHGIVIERLFSSLSETCNNCPDKIPPALRSAVLKWKAGLPFALNYIPYGDLMEAAYLLGVHGGKRLTSGMGLWGSLALLTRLGGVLQVGVNPGGGFYESILLPTDLSVPPEEIQRIAATRF